MSLAWAVQGANKIAQEITWANEEGDPVDLTSAVLSGIIRPKGTVSVPGTPRAITGTLTISTPATAGIFVWVYSLTDVSTEGTHEVQITATYPDTKKNRTRSEIWEVYEDIAL